MIDILQKLAVRIRPLRGVAVILGVLCLVLVGVLIFIAPTAGPGNRYLVPAIVGFLWCLSTYGFIDAFQTVPEKPARSDGVLARLKQRLFRAWFWVLAALFGISSIAALFLTFKLGSVWLETYYG